MSCQLLQEHSVCFHAQDHRLCTVRSGAKVVNVRGVWPNPKEACLGKTTVSIHTHVQVKSFQIVHNIFVVDDCAG